MLSSAYSPFRGSAPIATTNNSMFRISFEEDVGLCRGAQLVTLQRLALLSAYIYPPQTLTLRERQFATIWTKRLGSRLSGLLPTDAHDRLLLGTNQPFDRDADIPCPNHIEEFDDAGAHILRCDCPFVLIAQISRLPDMSSYVISGECWNLVRHSYRERHAAILSPKTAGIHWLPGTAAAWLPAARKLAWSSEKMAAISELAGDYTLQSTRLIWHDVPDIAWLFEIHDSLWAATTTCITCLAGVSAERAIDGRSYEWPQPRVGWCVCCDPYIVAAGSSFSPPFVLDTRSGSIQMLVIDEEPKVKEVFSIDIARENGTVRILTLHRSVESARAIVRIWEGGR